MKKKEFVLFNKEQKIKVSISNDGVTLWVNGRWIIDASTFSENLSFCVSKRRLKSRKCPDCHHTNYFFVGDEQDKKS